MTWQPIETAPRDGTEVLLTNINHHGDLKDSPQKVAAWWEGEGAWIVYCSMVQDPPLYFEPSHWQPLPEPPWSEAGEVVDASFEVVPESCGSCRFWLAGGVVPDGFGKCARFPPALITLGDPRGETTVIANQPVTPEDTTCGEWAARKAETPSLDVCPTTGGEHAWLDTSTNDGPGRKCQKCGRVG